MSQPTPPAEPILSLPDGRSMPHGGPPRIMGILNVTPDSFSDGGQWDAPPSAVDQAQRMIEQGADLIDVGGESTRPGAQRIAPAEQIRRTAGPIRGIIERTEQLGWPRPILSIDTTRREVAQAALEAGAQMLNDVSAGREDPGMLELAAEAGAPIVLMHMQGEPATMQADPKYQDVVGEVEAFLLGRVEAALAAGVPGRQILLDPGIGFGKTLEHNLALLKNLDRFVASGFPVLLGASRKRFIGQIATRCGWDAPPAAERVGGTCATTAMGIAAGVRWFRVHDVGDNRQAADVSLAIHLERSA